MLNYDGQYGGLYRAILLAYSINDIRIHIPGMASTSLANSSSNGYSIRVDIEQYKKTLPKALFNMYDNKDVITGVIHPCWVTFEAGDSKKPIIMGWMGNGITGAVDTISYFYSNDSSNNYNRDYYGAGTTGNNNADYVFKKLIAAGASIGGACAVLGNIAMESGFSPIKDNGNHRGIAQWAYNSPYIDKDVNKSEYTNTGANTSRWGSLIEWCDSNGYQDKYDTIDAQTSFLIYDLQNEPTWLSKTNELGGGWSLICQNITTETEVTTLTDIIREHYERCGVQLAQERKDAAIDYWKIFKNGTIKDNQYIPPNAGTVAINTINLAVKIANDDSYGYVWGGKGKDKVFDCSGFVWYCYHDSSGGGLTNLSYANTAGMKSTYTNNGFKDVTSEIDLSSGTGLITGDILLNMAGGHVDMYAGNGTRVGAHSPSTGIYVDNYGYNQSGYKNKYNCVLRYSE